MQNDQPGQQKQPPIRPWQQYIPMGQQQQQQQQIVSGSVPKPQQAGVGGVRQSMVYYDEGSYQRKIEELKAKYLPSLERIHAGTVQHGLTNSSDCFLRILI